jgi:predicted phage terminase large subunit-like protein
MKVKKKKKVKLPQRIKDRMRPALPSKTTLSEYDLIRSICKESFYDFVREFWSVISKAKPVWNWHIEYLCNELQFMAERVFRGQKKLHDLVVNISPGTTKSTIMSVMFPIWCWTRMPEFQFIGASYTADLARDLSMKSRDIVQSDKFKNVFPEITLREDQNTKGLFKNKHGGWRYAVGIDGMVTGMHAHFIVIDDPLDPQMSMSEADIKSANTWIINTLSNRKVDKAVTPIALVMQRLHQDDPTSRFLKQKNIKWVCLPAEILPEKDNVNPPELKKFYKKGLMDPVRLSRQVLEEERSKGELYYASQFLQNPVPEGGLMFKCDRIKITTEVPKKWRRLVRFWDKAGTRDGGAFTVGTLLGLDTEDRYWVLDVIRGQWDSWERERLIRDTAIKDGFKVLVGTEQEPGSGGKESAEGTLRRMTQLRGPKDEPFRCKLVKSDITTGGKIARADPFSVVVNQRNVYMVKADWNKEWIDEHSHFPNSRYKDQVDSSSGAFALCGVKKVRVGGVRSRSEQLELVGS